MADTLTMTDIAKALAQQNAKAPKQVLDQDLKEVKKQMADLVEDLGKNQANMSVFTKKTRLAEMKLLVSELKKFPEELFDDKKKYLTTVDNAVEQLTKSTSLIGKIQGDLKDKALGTIPKMGDVLKGFLDNTSPLIKVGLSTSLALYKYYKNWSKTAAEAADKQAKAAEALTAKSNKNTQAVADAQKDTQYVLTAKGQQLADKMEAVAKAETKERQKSLGPVAERLEALKELTAAQNQILVSMHDMFALDGVMTIPVEGQNAPKVSDSDTGNSNKQIEKMMGDSELYYTFIFEELEKHTSFLKNISDATELTWENTERQLQEQVAARQDAERDRLQNIQEQRESRKHTLAAIGPGKEEEGGESKGGLGHFLGGLLGNSIGVLLPGLLAAMNPMKLMDKIKAPLINFAKMGGDVAAGGVGKIGKLAKVIKGIPFIGPITTIAFSALDIYKAVDNAADILGKDKKDLTLWDKVSAGIGGFVGSFAELGDIVLGLFGFDTDIKGAVTKWTAKIVNDTPKFLADLAGTIGGLFFDVTKWVKDKIVGFYSGFGKLILDRVSGIVNIVGSLFGVDNLGDSFKAKVSEIFGGLKDMVLRGISFLVENTLEKIPGGKWVADKAREWLATDEKKEPPKNVEVTKGNVASAPDVIKDQQSEIQKLDDKIADKQNQKAASAVQVNTDNSTTVQQSTVYNAPLSTRNPDSDDWLRRRGLVF